MASPFSPETREATLAALPTADLDLLVVGGGITGAGVARDAALRGLAVGLVERTDWAAGTSSRSSKLIHGGVRYLEMGDVGLVRESATERAVLRRLAPHLAEPVRMVMPTYSRTSHAKLGIGLWTFERIATVDADERHEMWNRDEALAAEPLLDGTRLHGAAVFTEYLTDDARLVLDTVKGAHVAGALCANHVEATEISRDAVSLRDRLTDRVLRVRARVVVNAAGPWVDHVRRLEDGRLGTSVRLSKGAHVVLSRAEEWTGALTVPQDDVRVTFAVPWYDLLLLGTTDTEYEGDPAAVSVDPHDVDQILVEAAVALGADAVTRDRVRATFAGLRVLPAGQGESVSARRETVFTRSPGGMLTVAGGKLTTYRRIALEALERVRGELGLHRLDRRPWPLPGAVARPGTTRSPDVPPETRTYLAQIYGGHASDVLALGEQDPSLLERLHPDGPDIAAQVRYAMTHEWARDAGDVLRRRTTCFYRGLADEGTTSRVNQLLETRLEREGTAGR
jgi:glycerol-3-phosphate dehydrogenase